MMRVLLPRLWLGASVALVFALALATHCHAGWGQTDTSRGIAPVPETAVVVSGQLRGLQLLLGNGAISIPWRENLTLHDVIEGFGGFSETAAWVKIAEPGKPVVRFRLHQMRDKAHQKATKIPPGARIHFGWVS